MVLEIGTSSPPSGPLLNMGQFIFTKNRGTESLGGVRSSRVAVADVRFWSCLFASPEHTLIPNSSALTVGPGKWTLVLLVQPEADKRPQFLIHTHFHFLWVASHQPNCLSPYLPVPELLTQHCLSRLHHHAEFGG